MINMWQINMWHINMWQTNMWHRPPHVVPFYKSKKGPLGVETLKRRCRFGEPLFLETPKHRKLCVNIAVSGIRGVASWQLFGRAGAPPCNRRILRGLCSYGIPRERSWTLKTVQNAKRWVSTFIIRPFSPPKNWCIENAVSDTARLMCGINMWQINMWSD